MRGIRRIGSAVLTLLGAASAVFFLLRALPGDPATALAGEHASPETLARVRGHWGLSAPLPIQYLRYLGNLAQGDLGESVATGRPVSVEIINIAGFPCA